MQYKQKDSFIFQYKQVYSILNLGKLNPTLDHALYSVHFRKTRFPCLCSLALLNLLNTVLVETFLKQLCLFISWLETRLTQEDLGARSNQCLVNDKHILDNY